jgi:hypothetical protein
LQAYGWIKEHGGLVTEQQYEYVSEDGDMPECDLLKLKSSKAQRVTLKSFTQVPVGDEDALRKAIAHHPVSVAVAAQAWQVRVRVYVCVCACVCVCVCVCCVCPPRHKTSSVVVWPACRWASFLHTLAHLSRIARC